MPTLKEILVKQAGVPGNIEKSLPAGVPKVSQIMSDMATALPFNPVLPELPISPEGAPALPGGVADVIKGFEDILPAGVPTFGDGAQALARGGYRAEPVALAVKVPGRVLGGGYRSIS